MIVEDDMYFRDILKKGTFFETSQPPARRCRRAPGTGGPFFVPPFPAIAERIRLRLQYQGVSSPASP
jgi:hypothetical protein